MLKAIRLERGYTQAEVAEMAGIAQPTYSNIENGKKNPSINTLKRLARVLGCSIENIIVQDEDPAEASA